MYYNNQKNVKYLKDKDREGSTDVVIAWWLGYSDQKTEKQQQIHTMWFKKETRTTTQRHHTK